jgi:hypothetical protein
VQESSKEQGEQGRRVETRWKGRWIDERMRVAMLRVLWRMGKLSKTQVVAAGRRGSASLVVLEAILTGWAWCLPLQLDCHSPALLLVSRCPRHPLQPPHQAITLAFAVVVSP